MWLYKSTRRSSLVPRPSLCYLHPFAKYPPLRHFIARYQADFWRIHRTIHPYVMVATLQQQQRLILLKTEHIQRKRNHDFAACAMKVETYAR